MVRTMIAATLLASAAAGGAAPVAREITIGDGTAALHGTLLVPDGSARVPGVVIVAGSGPTDRDGNSHLGPQTLRNDSLRLLAEALAARGIASLRFDKRGIAASTAAGPAEGDLRFGTYVADAQAWVARLAAEPRVGGIVLVGHSEGALVATLAAQGGGVAGVVSLAGAGEPAALVVRRQLRAAGLPAALLAAADATLDRLVAGQAVADPPLALLALFRPSVQPYLMSWLPLDPAREVAKLTVPLLVVQGTTDVQIGESDARALVAARPGTRLALIAGMNHVLKTAPADRAANVATYGDPTLPLAPGLVEAVAGFVMTVAR